jgi:hypothetical protein
LAEKPPKGPKTIEPAASRLSFVPSRAKEKLSVKKKPSTKEERSPKAERSKFSGLK